MFFLRTMDYPSRRNWYFFGTCMVIYAMTLTLQVSAAPRPDKLTPDTRAPAHAFSSGGISRILGLPHLRSSGQTPAHTGLLKPGGSRPASKPNSANGPASSPVEDGITREETSSIKEVNGEAVLVVVGNYGYQSPEGLPVSVKYMSDENGYQAGFSIGAAAAGGGGGGGGGGGSKGKPGGGGGGGGHGGPPAGGHGGGGGGAGGGGGGGKMYLPPK